MSGRVEQPVSPAFLSATGDVLALVQARLGLEVCVLALKQADLYVVLDARDSVFGVTAGPLGPWSETLCSIMAQGVGPVLIGDVRQEPAYLAAVERTGLPIRSYAGVALRDRGGALLGSLCAIGRTAQDARLQHEGDLLATLGHVLGDLLATELVAPQSGQQAPRSALDAAVQAVAVQAAVTQVPAPRRPARAPLVTPHLEPPRPVRPPDTAIPSDDGAAVNTGMSAGAGIPGAAVTPADAVADASIDGLLRRVRTLFGLEAAFVSRLADGEQTFTHLDHDGPFPVRVGDRRPLSATLCQKVMDGELPAVITDATELAASRDVDVVAAGLVRTYLTVPVELADGSRYGTLCCLSAQPRPDLSADAAAALSFAAQEVGLLLSGQQARRDARFGAAQHLSSLLGRDGLRIALQPVVDLGTGAAVGYEALARFDDGRGPDQWFAEATAHGLGQQLELAAIELATAATVPVAPSFLAVNVSSAVLLSPGLARLLQRLADTRPQLLGRLVLELTEREQVQDYTALAAAVAPWRERGLRLSIDDTGAGHSSLAHVLRLRPDVIKLDRQLVTALDHDPVRRGLVASLQQFCAGVGVELIAEGVETAEEVTALRAVGVVLAQGFHLGRPTVPTWPA